MMLLHALAAALAPFAQPDAATGATSDPLPEIVVDRDNIVIDRSCRVVIPDAAVIHDDNGDGVIHIRDDNAATPLTIEFAPGSILRGAQPGTDPDRLTGIGVRILGCANVTVRGLHVEGYKVGLWATGVHDLILEDCRADHMWRQRLGSTPAAEDQADWLWPHKNDDNEWVTRYGAAFCVEDSWGVTVRRCTVRRGQNGLILDRVDDSEIYDNDFSFLSGWGLAMWRSSGNTISRNALDFCVRGYSHGVYNRGQDSAGLLIFEQCCDNIIAENSATHSGDGIFGFGGHLGDKGDDPALYKGRGCNRNLIVGNDLSYAPAHGLEMTFSFDNRIIDNRLVENAICGIWGGYSQSTLIARNTIAGNGLPGRTEGGGINIEHGYGNTITANSFSHNTVGVAMWFDADEALLATPWAKANHIGSVWNFVGGNRFENDAVGLRLTDAGVVHGDNHFIGVPDEVRIAGFSELKSAPSVRTPESDLPEIPGQTRPVGARPHLRGRDKIIMGQWGPWDHESVLVRRGSGEPGTHVYEIFGLSEQPAVAAETEGIRIHAAPGDGGCLRITIEPDTAGGVRPYRVRLTADAIPADSRLLTGTLVAATWEAVFFPWTADPREDPAAWRAGAESPAAVRARLPAIAFRYAHGGPGTAPGLRDALGPTPPPWTDRFGAIATTRLDLPAGRYRFTTLSDDGVRVLVRPAGEEGPATAVIENWTWHAPTRDSGEFVQPEPGPVEVTVEHFEIDGYAVLELQIEAVGD